MPLKLEIPFHDKDAAKNKGVYWDALHKAWLAPDDKDINDFIQWIDTKQIKIIIRAPFYLAINTRKCLKCRYETSVISLYSDNFYHLNYENEESGYETFQKVRAKSFFCDITYLDKDVLQFLKQNVSFFKLGFSETTNEKYWANHCEKCNSLLADYYNHLEPGGPFYPVTEEECKKMLLIRLAFKFDIGINGKISYSSNEDEIFELAAKRIY